MEAAFAEVTAYALVLIDAIALITIVYGTVEAFVGAIRRTLVPSASDRVGSVWLRYARWLVAGLTFQLAADIIETMTRPEWDDIGRLAAIAVIRTFLNFFLERDMSEARKVPGTREKAS
ncbi:hypothetical protein B5V01_11120 [Mesorhizobium erdmanii]|uniref:DUF1622 domain-containing protein n=2 Tax=Mesorhizobium TaxID=68287 RepID=A0A3M9XCS8_9HYPH|nr:MULTISPECIES: DUF1622 domain-containing protein [Mesorhizobium]RNJ45833.1 hypothetical protein DNR46_10265 [Mesorhizobium japonicum]RXT47140.1 hypothetical protein B5V01_11120 [Mesorhizobium erdmanii]